MNRKDLTLRIDATYGLAVKPGDKILRGQNISANQQQIVTSPSAGTVKKIRLDPQNHEFVIVVSLS